MDVHKRSVAACVRHLDQETRTFGTMTRDILEMADWLAAAGVTHVEGTRKMLSSRFAAMRVREGHRYYWRSDCPPEKWLLIEWPEGEVEPTKYWLSNVDAAVSLPELIDTAKLRWRIERDYQKLKQEIGLGHFEGRGWRGFHFQVVITKGPVWRFHPHIRPGPPGSPPRY